MQVLMATGAGDVDPVAINRASARMLSGADCEHSDELKTGPASQAWDPGDYPGQVRRAA